MGEPQGETYTGRPNQYLFEFFNGGKFGMVLTEGRFWREQRRFALHVLRDFGFGRNVMEERINVQIDELVNQIKGSIGNSKGKVLNLKHWIELCVGNVMYSLLFGNQCEEGDQNFLRVKQVIDDNVKVFSRPEVLLLGAYPWLRHVPLFENFGYKTLRQQRDVFYAWLDEEIQARRKTFDPSEEALDYVSAYLKEVHRREKSGESLADFTDWQLSMTIGDLFFAGLETTTTTLKWAILYMMHNPRAQEKCAQEIQALLDSRNDQTISMNDRSKLPYTAAALNEVQRLGNVIPMNLLHTVTQDTVMEGYILKQGIIRKLRTIVVPQVSAVMSDPKVFPDPDEFQPERFLEGTDDGSSLKKVEELVPFSIGKRACMGESLARMELFLIFVALVRNFRFSGKEGDMLPPLESVPGFTRAPGIYEVLVSTRSD